MGVPRRLWVGGPGWAARSCRASVSLRVLTQCVVLQGEGEREREGEKVRTHDERNNGLHERSAFHLPPHPIIEQKHSRLPQHRQRGLLAPPYAGWRKTRTGEKQLCDVPVGAAQSLTCANGKTTEGKEKWQFESNLNTKLNTRPTIEQQQIRHFCRWNRKSVGPTQDRVVFGAPRFVCQGLETLVAFHIVIHILQKVSPWLRDTFTSLHHHSAKRKIHFFSKWKFTPAQRETEDVTSRSKQRRWRRWTEAEQHDGGCTAQFILMEN